MDLVVYDDDDRRYVPWWASIAAVVLTGVLAAGITFAFARSQPEQVGEPGDPQVARSADAAPPSTASPAPTQTEVPGDAAGSACATALAWADAVAQRSTALDQALADHTRIMDELLAQRLTTEQALDQTLPVLTRGATERDRLEDELAAYRSSREACTP
ncbi:hypothetical protein [Cellulomonas aerilata]|uniref:Uncharacterized protein n=1 Tax=Cellulomonas aerilata TaxID=515326 RepID=A0A512DD38_9CELL|nr:hypothetical protein [Cellulomonas aerilata]GEO34130.1 hypothetical protein CAE01nite_18550 [Cellulomonas aerilata]